MFAPACMDNGNMYAPGVDFYQFRAVALWKSMSPSTNIYHDSSREEIARLMLEQAKVNDTFGRELKAASYRPALETYSSPFLYSLFLPFAKLEYNLAFKIYLTCILLAGVFGLLVFCHILRYPLWATFFFISFYMLFFEPVSIDARVGNVNQLQLGILGLYLFLQRCRILPWRHIAGGVILGLAAIFKPNIIFAVIFLMAMWLSCGLYRKLIQEALGMIISLLIALTYSYAMLGFKSEWLDWIKTLNSLPEQIITIKLGNVSPLYFLKSETGMDLSKIVPLLFCLLAISCIWKAGQRNKASKESCPETEVELSIIGMGCLVFIISSMLVWYHYLILAVPSILCLIRHAKWTVKGGGSGICTYMALLISIFIGLCGYFNRNFGLSANAILAMLAICLLLLFILSAFDMKTKIPVGNNL